MTVLVFRDDAYARGCAARVIATDERGIRLDRTVFYPTGGGQPGDTGSLRLASGESVAIVDAGKGDAADEVIHVPAPGTPLPSPGTELTAEIDWERRYRLMRMHSCLHPVCPVVRGGVARFRRPRGEPRQGGDRRPAQRADRRRPRGHAALDHRRGAGDPPG